MSSMFSVCPDCEGTGTDSARELTFTPSDLDEWYGDDSYERDAFVADYRRGAYSHPCQTCAGDRVVRTDALADIVADLEAQWEQERDRAMELRAGC